MTEEAPKSKTQQLQEAEAAEREAKNIQKAAQDYAESNPPPAAPYDELAARAKLRQDAADADRGAPPTLEDAEAAKAKEEEAKATIEGLAEPAS